MLMLRICRASFEKAWCACLMGITAEREQDIQQLGQIITAVQKGDIKLDQLQQLDLSGVSAHCRNRVDAHRISPLCVSTIQCTSSFI